MTIEKAMPYTVAQRAKALADYAGGEVVEAIAESLGKSVRSVIFTLRAAGVYKPVERTRVTKAMMISAIAVQYHVDAEELASLEKADKATLAVLSGYQVS